MDFEPSNTIDSFSQENLQVFIQTTFQVLSSQNIKQSQSTLDEFKSYLQNIMPDKEKTDQFFNVITTLIFPSTECKRITKEPFILFPIFYSFNPKLSKNYIDYLLTLINLGIDEINKHLFSFISQIFGQVVKSLFSNSSLSSNELLTEDNKCTLTYQEQQFLYDNLLSFCLKNIYQQCELQTCGCLFLTELIENCDLIKEEKHHQHLWNSICDYIDDPNFSAQLEILNCVISLIFAIEQNFKSYANVALFKVLDYLTDSDWLKRKLSLNVVYTLAFYCQNEIIPLRDYIIEFLNVLKNDKVEEVREVCLQTLKFLLEEINVTNDNNSKKNNRNKESLKASKSMSSKLLNVNKNETSNSINRNLQDKKKPSRSLSMVNSSTNSSFHKTNSTNVRTNSNKRTKQNSLERKPKTPPLRNQIETSNNNHNQKEDNFVTKQSLEEIEKSQTNNNTEQLTPIQTKHTKKSRESKKDSISNDLTNSYTENKFMQSQHEFKSKIVLNNNEEKEKISFNNTTSKFFNKKNSKYKQTKKPPKQISNISFPENNPNTTDIIDIPTQLAMLSKTQEAILSSLTSLTNKVNDNYNILSNRISQLEATVSNLGKHPNSSKRNSKQIDKEWAKIQTEISHSRFNEALEMSIAKDNYLFQVLQELNSKYSNIQLISQSTMEDVLSRIIALIPKGEKLDIIITFLDHIITERPKIKQLTKQNLKDTIKYLHQNYRNFNLSADVQKKLNKINNSIEIM